MIQKTYPPPDMPPLLPPPSDTTPRPDRGKGLAITASMLGLLSFPIPCVVRFMADILPSAVMGMMLAVAGITMAIIALAQKTTARSWAINGLALSILGLLFSIGLALMGPFVFYAKSQAAEAGCKMNLSNLNKNIAQYQSENNNHYPPSLEALVSSDKFSVKTVNCPATSDREWEGESSYFYCAPLTDGDAQASVCIVACDAKPNHPTGFFTLTGRRNVLWSDGSVQSCTESEFQRELQKPQNRRFAEEFAKGTSLTPKERMTYIAPAPPEMQPSPKESD